MCKIVTLQGGQPLRIIAILQGTQLYFFSICRVKQRRFNFINFRTSVIFFMVFDKQRGRETDRDLRKDDLRSALTCRCVA